MIDFDTLVGADDPADWIVDGGRPATAFGEVGGEYRCAGLPSYELETDFDPKGFQVFEFAILTIPRPGQDGAPKLIPRSYQIVSLVAPEGMVPLHHSPEAWWRYRPMLHERSLDGWSTLGSQHELAWRYALGRITSHGRDEVTAMFAAEDKAEALLEEFLTDWQLADYKLRGRFRVCGGSTGHAYEITPGDGFRRVDAATNKGMESFCLHPEAWLPGADVALATKWALEDPELEREALAGANSRVLRKDPSKTTPELLYARDMATDLAVL